MLAAGSDPDEIPARSSGTQGEMTDGPDHRWQSHGARADRAHSGRSPADRDGNRYAARPCRGAGRQRSRQRSLCRPQDRPVPQGRDRLVRAPHAGNDGGRRTPRADRPAQRGSGGTWHSRPAAAARRHRCRARARPDQPAQGCRRVPPRQRRPPFDRHRRAGALHAAGHHDAARQRDRRLPWPQRGGDRQVEHRRQAGIDAAARTRGDRYRHPHRNARPARCGAQGRYHRRRRRRAATGARLLGQARCGGDRRGHHPGHRSRWLLEDRRRLRHARTGTCARGNAGARRRRTDDHCLPAGQHRARRADRQRIKQRLTRRKAL
ncbi:hypothetical protein Lal_00008598 [Lupinus albus]|nr:hypothetical protein Lal_00008598 [Lupinus albus]